MSPNQVLVLWALSWPRFSHGTSNCTSESSVRGAEASRASWKRRRWEFETLHKWKTNEGGKRKSGRGVEGSEEESLSRLPAAGRVGVAEKSERPTTVQALKWGHKGRAHRQVFRSGCLCESVTAHLLVYLGLLLVSGPAVGKTSACRGTEDDDDEPGPPQPPPPPS